MTVRHVPPEALRRFITSAVISQELAQAGGVNRRPNMRVLQERAAMAVVDGDNAMGHLVVPRAVDISINKARSAGVAWACTRFSTHAGPASLCARRPLPGVERICEVAA